MSCDPVIQCIGYGDSTTRGVGTGWCKDSNPQANRIVENGFGRSVSSGSLLDSVHDTLYHG